MAGSGRLGSVLPALAYAVLVGLAAASFYIRPAYNWDMLPYVAVARSFVDADFPQLHRDLYMDLAHAVSSQEYAALTGSDSEQDQTGRADVARDPESFRQQLPFYAVKPVYPLLIAVLGLFSIDHFRASIIVTLTAYVLVSFLVWRWLRRHHTPGMSAVLAGLITLAPPLVLLARLSSPDMLSVLLIAASTYVLLEHRRTGWSIVLMLTAVLVRPNNVIWVVVMASYLSTLAPGTIRIERRVAVGVVAIATLIYVGITDFTDYYGFATQFHAAVVGHIPRPASFVSQLTPADYVRLYADQLFPTLRGFSLVFAIVAALGLVALRRNGVVRTDAFAHVIVICFITAVPLWLAAPPAFDRVAASQYLIALLIAAVAVGSRQDTRLASASAS